jgi:hypothetical protein
MFIGGAPTRPRTDRIRALYDQLEAYLPDCGRRILLPGVAIARRKNALIKSTNCSWTFSTS